MPEISYLCPLIQVYDMPESLRFYRDRLGFELVDSSGAGDEVDWCWLRLGSADLMLNTAYEEDRRPARPDPARVAAHRDTGLFFGCGDPESVHENLRARGLDVEPPRIAPYGMKQLYLRDPDGYQLCFQCPAEAADG